MDVLLIFLFVFGFAAWGIWKLYLAARDTYGDNSPLKVERVYKKSALSYFLGFDYVFSYFFLALAGILLPFLFTMNFSFSGSDAWIGFMLMLTVCVLFTSLSVHNIFLIHNYWKFTKDVVITSVPDKHEIQLDIGGKELTLKEDSIESLRSSLMIPEIASPILSTISTMEKNSSLQTVCLVFGSYMNISRKSPFSRRLNYFLT